MPAALNKMDPLPAAVAATTAEMLSDRGRLDAFMAGYLERQRQAADVESHPAFVTLYDDLREFVCRPGKRLRPLLFLLAHRIFGWEEGAGFGPGPGEPAGEDLLAVAASLEFLHGFILIHDDIIDRSETRRGLPTLHRVVESRLATYSDRRRAGHNLALVMGDILFALAQQCLLEAGGVDPDLRVRLSSLLLACMVDTGFGEAADILHGIRDVSRVSLPEVEHMYLLKTTRYTIECPLSMAAVLRGAGAAERAALSRIARPAGLAFQIQNDLQEFARFEVSDAEIPADILEGKKTLLLRVAFDLLNETDRSLLQLCFHGSGPTEAAVSKVRELVVKSGAVGQLGNLMTTLFGQAIDETERAPFGPAVRNGLRTLLHLVRNVAVQH